MTARWTARGPSTTAACSRRIANSWRAIRSRPSACFAILKVERVCALEPARAARAFAQPGFAKQEDYVVPALKEIPWRRWRELDPGDTLRFYALRLRESGMVKNTPQKLIAGGTDWRFFNDLKKELKG